MEKVVLYIDIESLLDLRQGFLVWKGVEWDEIKRYLESDEYNHRDVDDLMHFKAEEYRSEVEKGNKELVKNSILTFNLSTLITKILNLSVKSGVDGVSYTPEVWIDVHPFEFTDEEINGIKNGVFSHIGIDCFIEVVNLGYEKVTPFLINETKMDTCLIYNFSGWLNKHGEDMSKNPCLHTDLIFPPIYAVKPTDEDMKVFNEFGFDDGFTYMSFLTSYYAKIDFHPITYYTNQIIAREVLEELLAEFKDNSEEDGKQYEDEVEEYLHEHFGKQHRVGGR